jgi:hypothetical protein
MRDRRDHTASATSSGTKAINAVDDMKGLSRAFGGRHVPRDGRGVGRLPDAAERQAIALSQGVVDGEENPLPTIQSAKFFEVQKYLVLPATSSRRASSQSTNRVAGARRETGQTLGSALDTHGWCRTTKLGRRASSSTRSKPAA